MSQAPLVDARFRKALTLFDDYRAMLADEVRMRAYSRAIEEVVRPGDVVVDLGAGLGILSMLAVRAGAERVHAIELGDAAALMREVVAQNGMADRIVLHEAHSLDVRLDERADVLVSETLGSFAIDENTLPFTRDVRERLLVPGARMIPRELELFLAPVEVPEEHRLASFWDDVYGFDFSAARRQMLSRMRVADVSPKAPLASPQRSARIDLAADDRTGIAVRHLFPIVRAGTAHGLAGWFTAKLCEAVSIHTAPGRPSTHWRQAFFPFHAPVDVVEGDVMEVKLRLGPKSERSDDTRLSYEFRCTQIGAKATPPRG